MMNLLYIKKNISKVILINVFLLMVLYTNGQTKSLPEQVSNQIENYNVNAIKNRNVGNENAAASYLSKIAHLYWEYYIYDEANLFFEQVLTISQNMGNKHGEQKVLDNMAMVYSDMERFDKAIEYLKKSLVLLNEFGDKNKIASCFSNIAIAYSSNGQNNEAISVAQEGLDLSKTLNNTKLIRSFYGILYECFEQSGDQQKSIEYFGLYSAMDKHIQQKQYLKLEKENQAKLSKMKNEKENAIKETAVTKDELMQTKDTLAEVAQISKEQQLSIDLLNVETEVQNLTIHKQEASLKAKKRLIYFMILVFIMIVGFAYYAYRQMQIKKRANKKLQDLYNEIEKKNRQILDSISYASHIQEAILPIGQALKNQIPNSFIYYLPRDIVSGDFYWYAEHMDKVFIAAIDCTGHGVPGAFMSMIGNTLLNEIVNEQKIFEPAMVLQALNEKVINTLKQDSTAKEGFSEDGMDITFCCYDTDNNTIELALANHSACLVVDGEQQIIEGDIYSIGGNVGIQGVNFKNHMFSLESDATLYMYSDGYQDQFGGPKKQKFMAGRFTQYLNSIQEKPFAEHEGLLKKTFEEWMGDDKQIDDVLLIGLHFPLKEEE